MGRAAGWSAAILAMALAISTPAYTEEQLANPFGGAPPEYQPDTPDGVQIVSETWTGNFLGYSRRISMIAYIRNGKYHDSLSVMSSTRGDESCFVEIGYRRLTETRFQTAPAIGGCWKVRKTAGGSFDYVRDLGGTRYGPLECTRDPKRRTGQCTYTSASTGKKHSFPIRGKVEYW